MAQEKKERKENAGYANLIPPKKGEVRNPNGRPKGVKNRATYLNEILSTKIMAKDPLSGKMKKMPVEKIIDLQLVNAAMNKGDLRAIQMVKEILYGKIPQDINLGGQQDNPVITDAKITTMTPLDLLSIKYGANSKEVESYKEKIKS